MLLVEQLCRGLRYLHWGVAPDSTNYGLHGDPAWDCIYIRDMNPSNVWTHFPTQQEQQLGSTFDDSFPRVIIGDFGQATTFGDITTNPYNPNHAQSIAYDVRNVGEALRLLCFAQGHDSPINAPGTNAPIWPGRSAEDLRGLGAYSDELVDVLAEWDEMIEDYGDQPDERCEELEPDDAPWPAGWPDDDWLYDEALPRAALKVAQARAASGAPAALRAPWIDRDTGLPTDLTPRVFADRTAASAVMDGYRLQWTTTPAGSGGDSVPSGSSGDEVTINVRVTIA